MTLPSFSPPVQYQQIAPADVKAMTIKAPQATALAYANNIAAQYPQNTQAAAAPALAQVVTPQSSLRQTQLASMPLKASIRTDVSTRPVTSSAFKKDGKLMWFPVSVLL